MMRLDESQQRVQRKCRIVEEGLFQGGFILPVVLYLFGIELMEPDPEFLGQRAGFGAVDGLQISDVYKRQSPSSAGHSSDC